MFIWIYIKAIGKHWWALMSCAVFTILGLYVAYANKSNHWMVRSIFGASLALLFVASIQAWCDEHKRANSLASELMVFREEHDDNRPLIGMRVTDTSGGHN
jgi:hypothetical protein